MTTRILTRSANALSTTFRYHARTFVGFVVLAVAIIAICSPRRAQTAVTPAFVDAPTNLTVTAASNTSIRLSWNAVPGAIAYLIERGESVSGPFINVDGSNSTTYTDTGVSAYNAYVYRVRSLGGNVSEPSNIAFGTAISFEFNQLQTQPIKAQHIYDLRTAINAVRRAANMRLANWLRPSLNGQEVRASDIVELRTRLSEALSAISVATSAYTDPTLSTGENGTVIKAIHLEELQAKSTRGSSASAGPLYPTFSRAEVGEFGPLIPLPLVPVHLSVLPNRKILFWGRDMLLNQKHEVKQAAGHSEAYVWDMSTDQRLAVPNFTTNLFCSGHSFLPNGDLFVAGGHRSAHFDDAGEAKTNIFRYCNNSWTSGPNMNHGRWYPYNVTLATGEPLVMSGTYWDEPPGFNPYDPDGTFPTTRTTLTNFVPQIFTPGYDGPPRDLAAQKDNRLTTYPFVHLTSMGEIFQAQSGFFESPDHPKAAEQQSRLVKPTATINEQWVDLPNTLFPHANGTSVYLGDDRVLLIGGYDTANVPTKKVEVIDLSPNQRSWTELQSMRFGRAYHTATILPDGKVLVTGGVGCTGGNNVSVLESNVPKCSDGKVLVPELWDPQTGEWSPMAPFNELRGYHSVAALLPDGRVLVGGGGLPGAIGEKDDNGTPITSVAEDHARLFGHKNVEIYSPSYLFDSNGNPAARPVITSAPGSVTYGETFFVGTSGARGLPSANLIRLPSVTHGFNQDQRRVRLNVSLTSGGLLATVPTSASECPPGYYMLFVLTSTGVPSIANIVRVQTTSLFPLEVPTDTAPGDMQTWEQALEFSSSVKGQITHIKFWKAPGEPTGGHYGHIWTTTGELLATAEFVNETTSGWQEAQLSTPLPIIADVRYRVSYNIRNITGKTPYAFTRPVTNGQLAAWASFYSTPAGSFPTTPSSLASNLFVDVKFK